MYGMYDVIVYGDIVNSQPLYFEEAYELAEWYVSEGYDPVNVYIAETNYYDDFWW